VATAGTSSPPERVAVTFKFPGLGGKVVVTTGVVDEVDVVVVLVDCEVVVVLEDCDVGELLHEIENNSTAQIKPTISAWTPLLINLRFNNILLLYKNFG
jgi:hypothetical protein